MGKKVCCLYRVSTLKQVEKDDIPMQKQRCHEFATQMGWDIVREFSEKGVSGFKVSAKKRDAIQEIQREAAMGTFDMQSLSANIESLEYRLADNDWLTQELKEQHQQLLSWAKMFDSAAPAERKLIASHLIKAVTLTRGYGIQIDFNISEAQYLNGMEL